MLFSCFLSFSLGSTGHSRGCAAAGGSGVMLRHLPTHRLWAISEAPIPKMLPDPLTQAPEASQWHLHVMYTHLFIMIHVIIFIILIHFNFESIFLFPIHPWSKNILSLHLYVAFSPYWHYWVSLSMFFTTLLGDTWIWKLKKLVPAL